MSAETQLESEIAVALGAKLRQLREGRGYTQEYVAHEIGMNYKHYQELEAGGRTNKPTNPRLGTLSAIAKIYDIRIAELL